MTSIPPVETVSDSTYRAQEELLFRTAARLKGLVFYRLLTIPLLLLGGLYYQDAVRHPALLWSLIGVLIGFNLITVYFGFRGSDCTSRPVWLVMVDVLGITALASLTGGGDSHFVYYFLLLLIYTAIWFEPRLSWGVGALSVACVGILYFLNGSHPAEAAERPLLMAMALFGLTLGTANIAALVSRTRDRMVRATMDLIVANKRVQDQQQALRDSQERLRLVLDTAAEAIVGVDLDGRCIFANRSCVDLLGYASEADLLGRNMHAVMHHTHPDGRPYPKETCRVRVASLAGDSVHCDEEVHWRADGTSFPTEYWSHPIRQDGRVVGTVITFIDITERKRAEAELRRAQFIVENTPQEVWLARTDGRMVYANEAAAASLGYTKEEITGLTIADIDAADKVDFPAVAELLKTAPLPPFETVHVTKDGRHVPKEVRATYLRLEGEDYVCGFVQDITARKQAEEALRGLNQELEDRVARRTGELMQSNAQLKEALDTLQHAQDELVRSEKLASLGALVAGVAHELSTPLGNSLTVATTLAERTQQFTREVESGALRRSALNDYVRQSEQASQLLTRSLFQASELISHFKQVAVDQTSAQRRPFDLAEVVGEMALTLQPQFKKTTHQVELLIPAGIRMDSYPGPLGQVIGNLLTNALLHAFEGVEAGRVRIEAEPIGEGSVRMMVVDDGNGISAEHLSRIFDPFFTTRMGRGGSGLGLHIVYSIVTRMLGGRIFVTSHPGQGTQFTLELPLVAPEQTTGKLWDSVSVNPRQVQA
ncbi:MAG: PAS domain S-box protein [Thiobacillaceae bacterium]|jgi:PAS domain S-box-containing protein|nr:PAS domain S-box protein [Thiobacillaceae bacterium]